MFLKARGYLQNVSGLGKPIDEILAEQQAKIEAAAPAFKQWVTQAEVIRERAQSVSDAEGFKYDSDLASQLAGSVRKTLTSKGTHFNLNLRKEAILFPKGAEVPEISLNTLNDIAGDLEMASVRLDMSEATDEQKEALGKARAAFADVLKDFQTVVDHGQATLELPAVSGTPGDESLTAKSRDAMVRDLRYTIRAHNSLIGRMGARAGTHSTPSAPGSDTALEAEHAT